MKKIAIVLSLIFCFSLSGFAYQNAVFDDADLFTAYEEEQIIDELLEFSDATDYSLAVVTTDYSHGKTSMAYADDYLDELIDINGWQESSMLILIDMYNREIYISTAGECIDCYDSTLIDVIIDNGYSDLSNGFYASAVISMIDYATLINPSDYNSDNNYVDYYEYEYEYDNGYSSNPESAAKNFLIYLLIGLAVGGISAFAVKNSYKNFGKGDEFGSNDLILNLTASNDTIISRNVITTKIPKNNNNHHRGGGSGGGVHHSSAGRVHGGGGRKF